MRALNKNKIRSSPYYIFLWLELNVPPYENVESLYSTFLLLISLLQVLEDPRLITNVERKMIYQELQLDHVPIKNDASNVPPNTPLYHRMNTTEIQFPHSAAV